MRVAMSRVDPGRAEELRNLVAQAGRCLNPEEVSDLEVYCSTNNMRGSRVDVEWVDGRACWMQVLKTTLELGHVDGYGLWGYEPGTDRISKRIDFLGTSPIVSIRLLDGSENGRAIYSLREGNLPRTETGNGCYDAANKAYRKG